MQHVYWLIPGRIAGRSGPCQDPWELAQLKRGGVGAVLSVNDGALCHPDDFESAGIRYRCIPLSANSPPLDGDLQHCLTALPIAYDYARDNGTHGLATLVHCHAGKDRTGLFMAYYLVRSLGVAPAQAIARVKAVRSIAFTAPGWDEFAAEVLAAMEG